MLWALALMALAFCSTEEWMIASRTSWNNLQ
jgi:hypothetical protein